MGGNTEVDLGALRAVADHVTEAADAIAEMHWPALPLNELKGSSDRQCPCARPDRRQAHRCHREHARMGGRGTHGRRRVRAGRPAQRRPLPSPMTRPTVAQAEAWKPDALRKTADDWDAAAADLQARVDAVVREIDGSRDFWTGSAAEAARGHGGTIAAGGALGDPVPDHRRRRRARRRRADGFGARRRARPWSPPHAPRDSRLPTTAPSPEAAASPLLVSLAGGSQQVATDVLTTADRGRP